MNYNWEIIGDKIFGILRGRGYHLQMFDKGGMKTMDPHEATRFLASIPSNDPALQSYDILISVHDQDASSHMDIKTPEIKNDDDFDKLISLKNSLQTNIGDREGLSVNWYKFDHDIDARDDAVNNIKESRDIGKPFGTTKSSYQMIGDSKLIIRHTDPVNEEKKGSRWRHIKNIFIETKLGERFAYPYSHITGARAMARHLSNDGSTTDDIGKAITEMSQDYVELKRAARLLRSNDPDMSVLSRDALRKVSKDTKRLAGNRGYTKGIDLIRENDAQIDEQLISRISQRMHEACGCTADDSDESRALNKAARYVALLSPDMVDESKRQPHLYRGWDIDPYWDVGDGYWVGEQTHEDDDVRKLDLDLYHLEDPAGLDDKHAKAWRHVGHIDVSPYFPKKDEILAKVAVLKARHMAGDPDLEEESMMDDGELARIEELAGISKDVGPA